jgi:hypothetical protein
MASTFVICCRPAEWPEVPADAPAPDAVPHPSTPDHGPVVLLHVLRYHEGRRSEDMDVYRGTAGRVGLRHGVRIHAWLDVEGTVVGDGRGWDDVRFNVFPSRTAFEAVAFDPDRLATGADDRPPAIADTYTLMLRPVVDRLAESIGS